MIAHRDVIVLQDARTLRDSLPQGLTAHRFAVRSCGSMAGLQHVYAMHAAPLVLLAGEPEWLAANAGAARELAPAAAILALGHDLDTAARVRIMDAGADACHAMLIDIRELAAILVGWARHTGIGCRNEAHANDAGGKGWRHGRDPSRTWRLTSNGRVLACPEGRTLPLTGSETGFLARMAASNGQLLRREDQLAPRRGGRPDSIEGGAARGRRNGASPELAAPCRGDEVPDLRNVDVLVSRLRRKARHAGIDLPLLAVRGCGYLFTECLDVPVPVVRTLALARHSA